MKLRGDYASDVTYNVGDVVKYGNGVVYLLQNPCKAGTPPTETLFWGQASPIMQDIICMIMDALEIESAHNITLANNLTTTAAGKGLDARQGKTLKTLVDGVSGDLAELSPDAKTLVLASSTASSEKKFAITVDDDGELTATEITAEEEAEGGET